MKELGMTYFKVLEIFWTYCLKSPIDMIRPTNEYESNPGLPDYETGELNSKLKRSTWM